MILVSLDYERLGLWPGLARDALEWEVLECEGKETNKCA